MADQLFKIKQKERQQRISKEIKLRSESWLIVCEGIATEPKYFKGLLEYANSLAKTPIKFRVEGTGRNTESLIDCVDDFFDFTDTFIRNKKIRYGKVFAVFDKDSFKAGQFNRAIEKAISLDYIPIWSNECIELWFLLHFTLLESNIPRNEYFEKLSKIFLRNYKFKYEKSMDEIFNILYTPENLKNAMSNSIKLYNNSCEQYSPSKRCPCTTVFYFIEEIQDELKICLF